MLHLYYFWKEDLSDSNFTLKGRDLRRARRTCLFLQNKLYLFHPKLGMVKPTRQQVLVWYKFYLAHQGIRYWVWVSCLPKFFESGTSIA